jgi:hypothetical protein
MNGISQVGNISCCYTSHAARHNTNEINTQIYTKTSAEKTDPCKKKIPNSISCCYTLFSRCVSCKYGIHLSSDQLVQVSSHCSRTFQSAQIHKAVIYTIIKLEKVSFWSALAALLSLEHLSTAILRASLTEPVKM